MLALVVVVLIVVNAILIYTYKRCARKEMEEKVGF